MVDEVQSTLTPDEVGAVVAQWAERRKVDLSELAAILGVSEAQAASLLRQGRGRLNMNAWLQDKKASGAGVQRLWGLIAACLILGVVIGAIAASYFGSTPAQARPPLPNVQVTTSESKETKANAANTNLPPRTPPRPLVMGMLGPSELVQQNPDAAKMGAKAGEMLANTTVMVGHGPVTQKADHSPPASATAFKITGSSQQLPVLTVQSGIEAVPIEPDITRQLHDLTGKLRVPLPPDAIVDLQTPTDVYTFHGEQQNNSMVAGRIQANDLTIPMCQLVNYAIHTNIGQQFKSRGDPGTMGRIRIHVGEAAASTLLPWDKNRPEDFERYKSADSKVFTALANQVLSEIKTLGPKLFTKPKQLGPGAS